MQGMTKKMPGPLAPPGLSLPNLKMTALSYSCTTLIQRQREIGRVASTSSRDNRASSSAQQPGPAESAENNEYYMYMRWSLTSDGEKSFKSLQN